MHELIDLLCGVKKNTLSQTKRIISALLLVLLISVSILPLSLFHHHSSSNIIICENSFSIYGKASGQKELVSFKILHENKYEECLFCAWHSVAKLTFLPPEVETSQPDFVKSKQIDFQLTTVELFAAILIPNKGPPAFLLF